MNPNPLTSYHNYWKNTLLKHKPQLRTDMQYSIGQFYNLTHLTTWTFNIDDTTDHPMFFDYGVGALLIDWEFSLVASDWNELVVHQECVRV